jgi:hypothetical protein
VDFTLNRTSSNNAFNTFNPSWVGQMRYSFTQRILNGFGRTVNSRGIRIAQNNKSISDVQFEQMVIDLVSQAQKNYWDLVFTSEDKKVKQASLDLAEKTLSGCDAERRTDCIELQPASDSGPDQESTQPGAGPRLGTGDDFADANGHASRLRGYASRAGCDSRGIGESA